MDAADAIKQNFNQAAALHLPIVPAMAIPNLVMIHQLWLKKMPVESAKLVECIDTLIRDVHTFD